MDVYMAIGVIIIVVIWIIGIGSILYVLNCKD